MLSSVRKARDDLSRDVGWGVLWIGYLIVAAIHNIGESSIDTFTAQLSAILLLFAVCSSEKARGIPESGGAADEAEPERR